MDREFVFQTDAVEDFVLPQLSAALRAITESRSRSACPRLWSLTDRLNEAQAAAPKRNCFRTGLSGFNLLLGLFVLMVGIISGAAPLVFVGLAAWLWSLLRLSRHAPRVLAILNLAGSGTLVLVGALSPDRLGRVLIPGLITMAAGFVSILSHVRRDPAPFDSAAARLLEQRSRLPKGSVRFTDTGIAGRTGETIPYRDWEGCWETADLLLPVCRDSILILRKGELIGGDFEDFRSFLSQRVTIQTTE